MNEWMDMMKVYVVLPYCLYCIKKGWLKSHILGLNLDIFWA